MVQHLCRKGVPASTCQTYDSAARRFNEFCMHFNVGNRFPVNKNLLIYFAMYLAQRGLKEQSVKTYLAAVRDLQLTMGLPDPCDSSPLPQLRFVLEGMRRMQAESGGFVPRTSLPITPLILRRIRDLWNSRPMRADYVMPWAAVTLCFLDSFVRDK